MTSDAGAALVDADIARHLEYLQVERRLAARTLALYGEAFRRLQGFAAAASLPLRSAQPQHIRRWAAQLHAGGLAPRSIALALSAWRGFYRWLGREGLVAANPVDGVRAPRAPKPLPKALAVDHAVALVEHRGEHGDAAPRGARRLHRRAALRLRAARRRAGRPRPRGERCGRRLDRRRPMPAPTCSARAASGAACRSAGRRCRRSRPGWRAAARSPRRARRRSSSASAARASRRASCARA